MIGLYARPSDDLIATVQPEMSGSNVDPDYDVSTWNWSETHPADPAEPSKLTTTAADEWWEFDFLTAVTVKAFALIYHNFETGSFKLQASASGNFASPDFEQTFTIAAMREDGVRPNPWDAITGGSQTYRYWRIVTVGTNSVPWQVGYPAFLGELRDLGTDVRWGVVQDEETPDVNGQSEGLAQFFIDIYLPADGFTGQLGLYDSEAEDFISLKRSAHNQVKPWILISNVDVNHARMVRFRTPRWAMTREVPDHNTFDFEVQELARGLDWP